MSAAPGLSADLDAWTRRVLSRHFDPEKGSPFWLERLPTLGFDPLEITRYDELERFGPFALEALRKTEPADLLPRDVPRPLSGRVYESSGATGSPCRVFHTEAMRAHQAEWRRFGLRHAGFAEGRTWLHAMPSGPHAGGENAANTARLHASTVYSVDVDPRWIRELIRDGRLAEVNRYLNHLVRQISDVLESTRVHYLETTPALFQVLVRQRPELVAALDGIALEGTQVTPSMYREFTEALDGGLIGTTYRNALGDAMGLPARLGSGPDDDLLPYVPHYPQVTMRVVDKKDPERTVGFGEVGQLRITVLHDDLFLPNVLERDQAVRVETSDDWPCDGVANLQPLQVAWDLPEGMY
ncbi:arylcarboxylate reductase [Streptomyces armeniacus]|uniref:Arylcarboxylate reductase n=1 Tax=Streptomyces armeniacus TaxID=83291 RepID=A0A345Y0C2_9ACTN|nr:arylcarboxylate reductase [Streptomyces armeniacus]